MKNNTIHWIINISAGIIFSLALAAIILIAKSIWQDIKRYKNY